MAKRGEKWKQDWYLRLTPQAKLLYNFFYDNCNHIGVYEVSEIMMKAQIGFSEQVKIENHLPELRDHVEFFECGKILWVKAFIGCEYGVLGCSSSIHATVLRELGKYVDNKAVGVCFKNFLNENLEKISRVQVGYKYPNKNNNKEKSINDGGMGEENNVPYKYPTIEQVEEIFRQKVFPVELSKEMAAKFYAKHRANKFKNAEDWQFLVPTFITNYQTLTEQNEKKYGQKHTRNFAKEPAGAISGTGGY